MQFRRPACVYHAGMYKEERCFTAGPGAATDVVALYAPATANYTTQLFVKYILGSQIPNYVGTGTGQYT